MLPTQNQKLLDELNAGSKAALETLFRTYYPRLLAFARSYIYDADAAQDIVQEMFIYLWSRRGTISQCNIAALLMTGVRNRCINYIVFTETSGTARRQLHTTAHKHRHVLRHGFRGRDTRHSQPARQLPQHHSAKTEGGVHPCAHGRHDVARSSRQDGGVGCHGRQAGKEGSLQGDTTFQFPLPHGLCHHTAHCCLSMGSALKND